tara:strand:- start:86607 stop:87353 length:747 start_codon:yes stop_codon:yes gene_type:complete
MKHLIEYKLFEHKSKKEKRGELPYELPYIFNQLPVTVDHRLVEFICQNYGKEYFKSPWSHSYYSAKVGWTFKPNKSYRLANHWNFRTKTGNQKILHCETTSDVGKDNENWTIGQYDGEIEKYNVILSFPFIHSKENTKKVKALKEKYFKDFEYKPTYKSPFYKMNDEEKKEMIERFRFVTNHVPLMDFYVDDEKVELLRWGKQNIKFKRNGVEEIIKDSDLKRISYKGIYKGKTIIEKSKRESFKIYN